jgi:predicted methyltransferase
MRTGGCVPAVTAHDDDVLAYGKDQAVLLTGLLNPQVVRTAEMMDIFCIVFVRGKQPTEAMIELARERSLALLTTDYPMFSACGILYSAGTPDGNDV